MVVAALGVNGGDALSALIRCVLGWLDDSIGGLAEGLHDGDHRDVGNILGVLHDGQQVGVAVGNPYGDQLGHCDKGTDILRALIFAALGTDVGGALVAFVECVLVRLCRRRLRDQLGH